MLGFFFLPIYRTEQKKSINIFEIDVLARPYADGIWVVHMFIPNILKKLTSVCNRAVDC